MSLPKGQAAEIRMKYPHMLSEDSAVWRTYLGGGPAAFEAVWYDIHVGTAMPMPDNAEPWMKKVVDGVSRKRIDVVADLGNWFWIIELKPICGMAAIGQAVTYVDLFERELAEGKSCIPVVICDQVEEDVQATAERLGVMVLANRGVLL